jgi:hypothetical protein
MQVGPIRHTIVLPRQASDSTNMLPGSAPGGRPTPVLHVHPTPYRYSGDASPTTPGGMDTIYKDLIASDDRNQQVIADVTSALGQGRNCLVLTNWTSHLNTIASALRTLGHEPVILKGGTGAKDRASALARLTPTTLRRAGISSRANWLAAGFDDGDPVRRPALKCRVPWRLRQRGC